MHIWAFLVRGRTATQRSADGCEKVLEGFWGRVLRRVLRRGPAMGFTVKMGSQKGSQKGFWEGGVKKVPRTSPRRVRLLRFA